jgi:hypothetical protein
MGLVTKAGELDKLQSDGGGIVLLIESDTLEATESAISTPERIMGQFWPGERDALGALYTWPRGETLDSSSVMSSCIGSGRQDS